MLTNNKSREIVLLIHGLFGSKLDMWPLQRRLAQTGYQTHNWSYRSVGKRIEEHADRLATFLGETLNNDSCDRLHLVGHSMGGIILRAALSDERFDFRSSGKLGRLVMLASPNRGSHVATKLAPYFGWVSPSLEQLSDATNSYVNRLPNPLATLGLEFGIVEASKDRVIYPNALKLGGCAQYARIDGHHGLMSWYPQTFRVVESFLQTGQFYPERDHAASNRMVADI